MAGVIRRSRVLLKQMMADLDQFLVQLREAIQINVKENEQKISSSASDASSQNSIDRAQSSRRLHSFAGIDNDSHHLIGAVGDFGIIPKS
jgi:hypothetical protein